MRLAFRSYYFRSWIFVWFLNTIFILSTWNSPTFLFIYFITFLHKIVLYFLHFTVQFYRWSFLFKHFFNHLSVFWLKIFEFFLLCVFYRKQFVALLVRILDFMMLWFAWKHLFRIQGACFMKNLLIFKIDWLYMIWLCFLFLNFVFIVFRIISFQKVF